MLRKPRNLASRKARSLGYSVTTTGNADSLRTGTTAACRASRAATARDLAQHRGPATRILSKFPNPYPHPRSTSLADTRRLCRNRRQMSRPKSTSGWWNQTPVGANATGRPAVRGCQEATRSERAVSTSLAEPSHENGEQLNVRDHSEPCQPDYQDGYTVQVRTERVDCALQELEVVFIGVLPDP